MVEHLARALAPPLIAALAVCLVGFGGVLTLNANAQVTPAETTQGEVVSVGVERLNVARDDDRRKHYVYEIDVRYRYEVGDESYVGDRLARPDTLRVEAEGAARTYRSELQAADGVTVYYDPARPERSYLRATYPVRWLLAHTVGWALLLGLVARDTYGVASWCRGLVADLPVVGARTPLGTAAALPVYAVVWYLALVPWWWHLDRGDPGGFGFAPVAAAVLLVVVWAGFQVNAWLHHWADTG